MKLALWKTLHFIFIEKQTTAYETTAYPYILCTFNKVTNIYIYFSTDSRVVPGQWEMAFLCNNASHWLGANLESSLYLYYYHLHWNVTRKPVLTIYIGSPGVNTLFCAAVVVNVLQHIPCSKPSLYMIQNNLWWKIWLTSVTSLITCM